MTEARMFNAGGSSTSVAAAAAAAAAGAAQSSPEDDTERLRQRGNEAFQRGSYSRAADLYKRVSFLVFLCINLGNMQELDAEGHETGSNGIPYFGCQQIIDVWLALLAGDQAAGTAGGRLYSCRSMKQVCGGALISLVVPAGNQAPGPAGGRRRHGQAVQQSGCLLPAAGAVPEGHRGLPCRPAGLLT